ncbi:MAG TPA: hypothetical protein DIC59_15070 [Candidatus Competibacteraceae bacterium]|nr:hypothetical protein [Candidatus Competibacteraceae bacterium]
MSRTEGPWMLRCSNGCCILHCSNFKERAVIATPFKLLEASRMLAEPLVRLNRAAAANAENMVAFQMSALNSYLTISLNQLKAAAEITDIASLQDFCQRQTEIAKTVQQKLLSDARAISGIDGWFTAEMDDLALTVLDELLPKAV